MIEIIIHEAPIAKGRHRFSKFGGVYTPKETVNYENLVKDKAQKVMELRRITRTEEPVFVSLKFFLKKPKNCKTEFPTKKPDIDNLIKSVLDALNGVVFKDDKQIIQLKADKFWSDGDPSTEIYIYEILEPANDKGTVFNA